MNPLLQKFETAHESAPFDLIEEAHFIPAIEQLIAEAEKDINTIANNPEPPDFENTLEALERNGEQLGRVVEILFNLNHAETNEQLQEIAQEVSPKLSEFSSRMWMNGELFQRVKTLYEAARNSAPTQSREPDTKIAVEQQTLLQNYYDSFIRNGAELPDPEKARFAEIKSELSKLTLSFGDHVLAETNAFSLHLTAKKDLEGLPDFVIEAAREEAENRKLGGWIFTLHFPSYVPFMKYSRKRELRKKMFMAYSFRGNQGNEYDNKELIQRIVNLRLELAQLLGAPDYASHVLQKRMAKTSEQVNQFIASLHLASRPFAEKEFAAIREYAKKEGHEGAIERWDWAFWSEKLRKEQFDISDEQVKPYFELERVSQGVFNLATQLYGLQFKRAESIAVYHNEVTAYEVFDTDGEFLALFYTDFFPRKGKQGGAWMTDFRSQDKLGGDHRPHVSIVCNFTRPTADKPSLLTFDEVNTFLHEFGHALHGMLSNVNYPSISGTSVYRDFVELPSQIMENWLTEKEWLDQVAEHYKTGEKMPMELLQKLIDAKNYQAGYLSERQLSFGMNDMAWHSLRQPFEGDVIAFEKAAIADTELFPEIPDYCMSTAFSHIFSGGYAAGYYGYKWAEVLDADAFSLFQERGLFNVELAQSFRKNILEKGGTEDPMELYKRFRGQEPDIEALLKRSGLYEE